MEVYRSPESNYQCKTIEIMFIFGTKNGVLEVLSQGCLKCFHRMRSQFPLPFPPLVVNKGQLPLVLSPTTYIVAMINMKDTEVKSWVQC